MEDKVLVSTERVSLRSQAEILSSWEDSQERPLVSICCQTYNHELYIEDAIIGFLSQETDFPFEILIHDDASTDGTTDIIRKYEELYPKLIKPIYQVENQYSKGKRPFPFNHRRASGEYIAICEGDDYWTDSKKLQTQVDILESQLDVSICYHKALIKNDASNEMLPKHEGKFWRNASPSELMTSFRVSTQTMMLRESVLRSLPQHAKPFGGDKLLVCAAGTLGRGHFCESIQPSVFRRHSGGVNSSIAGTKKQSLNRLRTSYYLWEFLRDNGLDREAEFHLRRATLHALVGMTQGMYGVILDASKSKARIWLDSIKKG